MLNSLALFLALLFTSSLCFSHSGGVLSSGPLKGCHSDDKRGNFHCHSKSSYEGFQWNSKSEALNSLVEENTFHLLSDSEKYDRSSWGAWVDEDGDCLNTRHEILKARSLIPVIVVDCKVVSGEWSDFYYDENLTNASQIHIDHVVPLKHAYDHGAKAWSARQKGKFYLDDENLVVTNKKYNLQKGSHSFIDWLPINRAYACKYAKKWFAIKKKYKLLITDIEVGHLEFLNCP